MNTRPAFTDRLIEQQAQRLTASLQRRLRSTEATRAGRIVIDRRELIDFGSNDYLGFAHHPLLIEAWRGATTSVGARASHLLGGHRPQHAALEESLANWLGYPRVLLFSTGYMAAIGSLVALLGRHDLCLQDRLNHACLLDGARLAGAHLLRYQHLDTEDAARILSAEGQRRALLVTDSVFSMDGDIAPLPALAALCQREKTWLMVDEAHALGVLGPQGRGACAVVDLQVNEVPVLMGTLGKALGGFGAFIAGSELLIDTLINAARTYIYTTALPPPLAQTLCVAVQLAREADEPRAHLQRLIAHFRAGAQQQGWNLLPSTTPIQPLLIGASDAALQLAQRLESAGCYCPAVRAPTVPIGSARLRISLSAAHSLDDVDHLLAALGAGSAAVVGARSRAISAGQNT